MFVQGFPSSCLVCLCGHTGYVRHAVVKLFLRLLLPLVRLCLYFFILYHLSVSQVAPIKLETFELFGQWAKALFSKELVRLEDLRLADEEVSSFKLGTVIHL